MSMVKSSFLKIASIFKKIFTGKFKLVAISLSSIIFLYAVYFIFIYSPSPSDGGKDGYWKDYGIMGFHIFSAVLILGLLFLGFYLLGKRKLSTHRAAVIIALIGAVFVMVYGLSTPIYNYGSTWNQHDLYYGDTYSQYMNDDGILDGGGGHFGLIMTIFRHNMIPEVEFKDGAYDFSFGILERYQPKTFYLLSAYYMKFNSLFIRPNNEIVLISGSDLYGLTYQEWALFESLRLLYTMMEWLQIYFIYKIFVRVHLHGKGLIIAFALAVLNPMWCFYANWANNDGMSTFFAIVAFYYALCFIQDRKTYQSIAAAASIGLSMSCKLGGALMAIVIAPMLIYAFASSIKTSIKGERKFSNKMPEWLWCLIQLSIFAAIVFPIGLFWPIWNYVKFGQPIVFFSPVTNSSLYIQNENFFERFVLFPNSDVFRLIWVFHSNSDPNFTQDTSLITALIKTSLYGEYGFGLSSVQCAILYVSSLTLVFLMMVLLPFRFVRFMISKNKAVDKTRLYAFASMIIVFYGWAVYFVNSYPHTCNQDMRYIAPIILPLCGLVGSSFDSFGKIENKPLRLVSQGSIIFASVFFSLSSIIAYLTLSPWYYR